MSKISPRAAGFGEGSRSLTVDLHARSYDIVIGHDLLEKAGAIIAPVLRAPRVAIVTDNTVAKLYLDKVSASLTAAGLKALQPVVVHSGEGSKNFQTFEKVVSELLAQKIDRSSCILALGGGVVGDLAGFAASAILRGIDFIQLPTTLLAQVDSSVGGKTGINTAHGKNLVGAFYQPRMVLADTSVLKTLPKRELLAGYAEVVKYGLINKPEFFAWLEANGAAMLSSFDASLDQAVEESCRAKAEIVAADEREADQRALLNLGHTFGHALEAIAGYDGSLLHGEAVAIGMVQAFDFSAKLGLCPPGDAKRVRAHLQTVGLPVCASERLTAATADKVLAAMQYDKKASGGKLTFVLARGIGKSFLSREVATDQLEAFLKESL